MKKLITLFLFCFFISQAFSQSLIVFSDKTTERYLIKYENSYESSQRILNELLQVIADERSENIYYTQLTFEHEQLIRIITNNKKVIIEVDFNNFRTGQIIYKGFDISEVFVPSKITFKGELLTTQNKHIANYSRNRESLNPYKNHFEFKYLDSLNYKKYNFIVNSKSFIYTNENKELLTRKQEDINYYHSANNRILQALSDLSYVNPDNINMIFEYEKMIQGVEHLIAEIEKSEIKNRLNLNENDPSQFLKKYDDLKYISGNLGQSVRHTISILYEIYYNKGLEFVVNEQIHAAKKMFHKSLEINPVFAPSLFQLAKLDYKDNKIDEASSKILDIFSRMKPDPNTYNLIIDFSSKLVNDYMNMAEDNIKERLFENSLRDINNAEELCNKVQGLNCSKEILVVRIKAKKGIYNNYLNVAKKYLAEDNLDEAEKHINNAISYQRSNSTEVRDADEANKLLLIIKEKEYYKIIENGRNYLKIHSNTQAFETFQKAEQLQKKFNFEPSKELLPLLQKSLKPIILLDIEDGFDLVKNNNIRETRAVLKKTERLIEKYSLTNDKEIANEIIDLKNKIFKKECQNVREKYSEFLLVSQMKKSEKKYIEANIELNNAISAVNKMPECKIDKSRAENEKNEILSAVTYQKMLRETEELIDNNKFQKAVEKYMEASTYFEQLKVEEFGLKHLNLFEFSKNKKSLHLAFMLRYFTTKKEFDNSLELLKILKQREYNSRYLKEEQKQLGNNLAVKDYNVNADNNFKEVLNNYTGGDKWYKYLKKEYTKKWRKLSGFWFYKIF